MSDVKVLVQKTTGEKSELSSSDILTIPVVPSHPVGNPPSGYVYLYALDSNNHFYQKDDTGTITDLASTGGGGSITVTELEIDFGTQARKNKNFTIVDVSVIPTSKIIVVGNGKPATGRGKDDWEFDAINFYAEAGAGSFTLYASSATKVKGKRNILYTVN